MKDGFIPVACGTPKLRLADCDYNAEQTFTLMRQAERAGAKVLVLPELGLTGYTCGDLFYQDTLLRGAEQALLTVLEATRNLEVVTAVGLPVQVNNRLYNCAAIIQRGRILGLVPKTHIPNYGEFYEKRQFAPAPEQGGPDTEWLCGDYVSFGAGQLFRCQEIPELVLGFEICEDLWTPGSPSVAMAQGGATVIGNLSASNEVLGKDAYRRQLVTMQSAKLLCGYLYASAGEGESTSDLVFGAHQMIAENGTLLAEQRYEGGLLLSEIDVQRLAYERRRTQILDNRGSGAVQADFSLTVSPAKLTRYVAPQPFVPEGREDRDERCREILLIASLGLKHRLEHTGAKTAVVGLSGGLDSTLAVLITGLAMKMLNRPMTDIIAVTMPCFGTTERTKSNAVRLCAALGVTLRDIPIGRSVEQHFRDIGHDPQDRDVTYENCQARERTQVIMDIANQDRRPGHRHRRPPSWRWAGRPTTATTCPCTASTPPCRKRWCAISWPRGGQGGRPGCRTCCGHPGHPRLAGAAARRPKRRHQPEDRGPGGALRAARLLPLLSSALRLLPRQDLPAGKIRLRGPVRGR
jgi:NAD+ synthase (glutamine-hydrolysing)